MATESTPPMKNLAIAIGIAFFPLVASAQFYTVSDSGRYSISHTSEAISEDTCIVDSGKQATANPYKQKAAKAKDNRARDRELLEWYLSTTAKKQLPELTLDNLLKEIRKNGIKYPKIVLAQAILETGWFKSSVCRHKHNLFGLTNPRTGQYYVFNHWTESVRAYYTKVQYRYKGGNYLLWLQEIGYAEDKNYVPALIKLLKQM